MLQDVLEPEEKYYQYFLNILESQVFSEKENGNVKYPGTYKILLFLLISLKYVRLKYPKMLSTEPGTQ